MAQTAKPIDLHAGQTWSNGVEDARIVRMHMGANGVLVAEFIVRRRVRAHAPHPWSKETHFFIEPDFRTFFPRYR